MTEIPENPFREGIPEGNMQLLKEQLLQNYPTKDEGWTLVMNTNGQNINLVDDSTQGDFCNREDDNVNNTIGPQKMEL